MFLLQTSILLSSGSGAESMLAAFFVGLIMTGIIYAYNKGKDKYTEHKGESNPYDVKSQAKYANYLWKEERYEDAKKVMEKVYRLEPDNLLHTTVLAIMCHEAKEHSRVKELMEPIMLSRDKTFDAAFEDWAAFAQAMYFLGYVYHLDGDEENKKEAYDLAVAADKKVKEFGLY